MDHLHHIREQLEATLLNYPDNESLKSALEYSVQLEQELLSSTPKTSTWLALVSELRRIQGQGLWGTVDDQRHLFDSLAEYMERSNISSSSRPDLSFNLPTSQNAPVLQTTTLPPELLDQINEVYLLHNLATNPSKALPPGKSLLSVFSSRSRHTDDPGSQKSQTLKDRVSEVVTRAFWDEAFESLSSPTPSVQLSRLRLLYADLSTVVAALIPSSHAIMHTLSNPLSPTLSPLRSAVGDLVALLSVLRERCAPVRDAEIDQLLRHLDDASSEELPRVFIDNIRGIFDLAERMKHDLADFVIGTWTERDARQWIRREAIERERRIIMGMLPAQAVKSSYHEWLGTGSGVTGRAIVTRLMKALASSEAISPFPPSNNTLPPPLIFTAFDLLKVQNLLQALVIAAALRSLVRPVDNADTTLLSRIWPLLKIEVDRGGAEPTETKLLNLEDEVVQAARLSMDLDAETRLREAVRRTLRSQDPVFVLLQSRLVTAIQDRLVGSEPAFQSAQVPAHMRSGRGRRLGAEVDERSQERELSVRGFDDPVLKENVRNVVVILRGCLEWVEEAWSEFLDEAAV